MKDLPALLRNAHWLHRQAAAQQCWHDTQTETGNPLPDWAKGRLVAVQVAALIAWDTFDRAWNIEQQNFTCQQQQDVL